VILIAPRPEPSDYLIDQYLVAAETMGVEAIIVANKMDLLDADERAAFQERFAYYADIGYSLLWTSLREPETLVDLIRHLGGQTSILVGQSGVGKSSWSRRCCRIARSRSADSPRPPDSGAIPPRRRPAIDWPTTAP
jgi:ribosome biogenesis GTPase / thiamine phosphate phosphatase